MSIIDEFTVLLIDDNIPSMDEYKTEIIRYLNQEKAVKNANFLEVHVVDDTYKDKVKEHLENRVDMVLTDNSMIDEDDGLALAKSIRDDHPLLDILLYSTKEITKDDYRDLSYYTQIQTHPERNITDVVKRLIDRNLAKWDDMFFLRGIVISESIEVELKINDILTKYFEVPDGKKPHFDVLVLENFSVSLEAKKISLRGVLAARGLLELWEGISGKIQDLQGVRNKLAHGRVVKDKINTVTSGGTEKTFDRNEMITIFTDIKQIEKKLQGIDAALQSPPEENSGQQESS